MFPVLLILLFIKALFYQDWKKNISPALSPSHYQAETEILKNYQLRRKAYILYIHPTLGMHLLTASSQVRQLILSLLRQRHQQVVTAAWRRVVVLSLRTMETEQGFSTAAQKSSQHRLILTCPLTHITLALPSWGRVDKNSAENLPPELQSKITHTHTYSHNALAKTFIYIYLF